MLTVEQKTIVDNIINEILRFRSTGVPFLIRVGGYAGTGKTFMLANLRRVFTRGEDSVDPYCAGSADECP